MLAVALAIPRLVEAQCNGVELLVDGQLVTTPTLYYPVGSFSAVSCRCTGNGTPTWTYSNGTSVPSCSLYTAVCSSSSGVHLRSQNLTFYSLTQSLAGRYDCTGDGYTTSVTILNFGE